MYCSPLLIAIGSLLGKLDSLSFLVKLCQKKLSCTFLITDMTKLQNASPYGSLVSGSDRLITYTRRDITRSRLVPHELTKLVQAGICLSFRPVQNLASDVQRHIYE